MATTTCTTCPTPLPHYAAVCGITTCFLCGALKRQHAPRQFHDRPAVAPDEYSRHDATAMLVTWARAHDNTWPATGHFGKGDALPSINVIRLLWGSLNACRSLLSRTYPDIRTPRRTSWSGNAITCAVAAWMADHDGRIPMHADFKRDDALPFPSSVCLHAGSIANFYRTFADGLYLRQYMETRANSLGQASRQALQAKGASCGELVKLGPPRPARRGEMSDEHGKG